MHFRRIKHKDLHHLQSFAATQFNKIFAGSLPRQKVQKHRWFRDRVLLHHQGSEDGEFLLFSPQELVSLT